MEKLTESKMLSVLDYCYDKALNGIPMVSESSEELAEYYLNKYHSPEKAVEELVSNQLMKCTTSGFVTGLGGLLTMPVSIPANISSVIYIQLRMIAGIAYIGGYDIKSDEVKALAYVCLTGKGASDILKSCGIAVANKVGVNLVKKIPTKVLTVINQKVGFRLVTKFGEKGIINLGKAVPFLGGIVGGGFDYTTTKTISKVAINMFLKNKI